MESTPVTSSNLFEIAVDQTAADYLKDAARWARFLAILGFIVCGLFVLFALFAGSVITYLYSSMLGGMTWIVSFALIVVALLQFFPCLFLYRFASKALVAIRSQDQIQLNESFKNMRALYRYIGILTIIYLGIYVLVFIGSAIGGILSRH